MLATFFNNRIKIKVNQSKDSHEFENIKDFLAYNESNIIQCLNVFQKIYEQQEKPKKEEALKIPLQNDQQQEDESVIRRQS